MVSQSAQKWALKPAGLTPSMEKNDLISSKQQKPYKSVPRVLQGKGISCSCSFFGHAQFSTFLQMMTSQISEKQSKDGE